MKSVLSLRSPMQSIFWTNRTHGILYNLMLGLAGVVFLTVAAQIAIPLQPVPMTLQSFAVLFIGMTYGWRLGTSVVIAYLLLGIAGVQVFSGLTSGISIVLTSGYLLGFVPAAFLSGFLVEKGWGRNAFSVAIAALLGFSVIFASGLTVLALHVGWKTAIAAGLLPFLLGETLKLLVLVAIVPFFWRKKARE